MPDFASMTESLVITAGQAMFNGIIDQDTYNQRLATCFSCEKFIHDSRRCSICGCFMVIKARIGGDPKGLCPLSLWQR